MIVSIPKYKGFSAVSPGNRRWFVHRVLAAGYDPRALAEVIEFESAREWKPDTAYKATGGARTGLIQFTAGGGAKMVGKTTKELSRMTFREQLEYVIKYLDRWGPLRLNDAKNGVNNYHLACWGEAVGAPKSYVLASTEKNARAYEGNRKSLDKYPPYGEISVGELDRVTRENALSGANGEFIFDTTAPLTVDEAVGDVGETVPQWLETVIGAEYWRLMKDAR